MSAEPAHCAAYHPGSGRHDIVLSDSRCPDASVRYRRHADGCMRVPVRHSRYRTRRRPGFDRPCRRGCRPHPKRRCASRRVAPHVSFARPRLSQLRLFRRRPSWQRQPYARLLPWLYVRLPLLPYARLLPWLYVRLPLLPYALLLPWLYARLLPWLYVRLPLLPYARLLPWLYVRPLPWLYVRLPLWLYARLPLWLYVQLPPWLYAPLLPWPCVQLPLLLYARLLL